MRMCEEPPLDRRSAFMPSESVWARKRHRSKTIAVEREHPVK